MRSQDVQGQDQHGPCLTAARTRALLADGGVDVALRGIPCTHRVLAWWRSRHATVTRKPPLCARRTASVRRVLTMPLHSFASDHASGTHSRFVHRCADVCASDELVTCRTITSAFGPQNVIEALCNDQEPYTAANMNGASGQCSGAASLHGVGTQMALLAAAVGGAAVALQLMLSTA